MNREQKAAAISEIAGQLKESEAVFAVDYRGISVPQAAELRVRLRDADATFRVVKNTLTERAADEAGADTLKTLLEGPTALTFVHGDAALAAKAIATFARETDTLAFKGGLLGAESVDAEQILAISRLPARDVLYGQLVGLAASPITGLVRGLNALIAGLAIQLSQINEKKQSGEIPAGDLAIQWDVCYEVLDLEGVAVSVGSACSSGTGWLDEPRRSGSRAWPNPPSSFRYGRSAARTALAGPSSKRKEKRWRSMSLALPSTNSRAAERSALTASAPDRRIRAPSASARCARPARAPWPRMERRIPPPPPRESTPARRRRPRRRRARASRRAGAARRSRRAPTRALRRSVLCPFSARHLLQK